jgi:hypothetical protein
MDVTRPRGRTGTPLFARLYAESWRLCALLNAASRASGDARSRRFQLASRELLDHTTAVEAILYPELTADVSASAIVSACIARHARMAHSVRALGRIHPDSPAWPDVLQHLVLQLEELVADEQQLFPIAVELLSERRASEIEAHIFTTRAQLETSARRADPTRQ